MKTNLKDFSLTPLGKVQPRATMAPFEYVLWMLVLFCGGLSPVVQADMAYIANEWGGSVSVIDTSSNSVVAKVTVGRWPFGVAVNPAGTRVYVTNTYNSNNVSVIDTSNNSVVATVTVGNLPYGVAVNPAGTRVYVANSDSNNVSVIDTSNNSVVATVPVGTNPHGVAVNPAGTRAYVVNHNSNSVSVIDTSNNSVVSTVPVGTNPIGVAVNPAGTRVYVADGHSNTVSAINTSNNSVVATVAVGSWPTGVAVNPAGTRIYVSNGLSDNVSVIDTSTNSVVTTVTVGITPYGISVNSAGTRVYVVNLNSNDVSVIDTNSNSVVESVTVGGDPYSLGQFIRPDINCNLVTEIPVTECQALLSLYNSTGGANWRNKTGWNQTNAPCSWSGVSCEEGHVTEISLPNNSLTGPLSTLNWPSLQSLNLRNNQLTGDVPTSITTLPLVSLNIECNQLTATDSSVIAFLKSHNPDWNRCQLSFLSSPPLTSINAGEDYSYTVGAQGTAPLTITALTKPDWLTLTDNGNKTALLSGLTTNRVGTYHVVLQVQDFSNQKTTQEFDITLNQSTVQADFGEPHTSMVPDASNVITLNAVESGITLSEITLPQNNAQIDQPLSMVTGKATDNRQGILIKQIELTLQDQNTKQYLSINSDDTVTFSTTPQWITAEGKIDWIVNTDQVSWVPGHSYLVTARAVDLAGVISAEKMAQFVVKTAVFTSCAAVTEIPVAECDALVALYNSTDGPHWADSATKNWDNDFIDLVLLNGTNGPLNNWLFTDTPCSWEGITCSAENPSRNVIAIHKPGNLLKGTLPDLSPLTKLTSIRLGINQLSGTIPNFNLPALQELELLYNQFSGPIPNFNLPVLQRLDLSNNQLSGPIPNFNLPALQWLLLHSNQLSGSIPNFNLPALQGIHLDSNQLSGQIPNFNNLPALWILNLSSNQFSGPIPNFNLPALRYLFLKGNQLSGQIPNFDLPALQNFDLSHNQLSGQIPSFDLPTLQEFDLSHNQLSGQIPNFNNLPALESLVLTANQLSGPIPNFDLPALQEFDLSHNQLSGPIPNFNLPELREFVLSHNQLSGPIPDFNNLPELQTLYLSSNQLSGEIPSYWISKISLNQLGVEIPNWITGMYSLDLDDNYLTASNSMVKLFLDTRYPGWQNSQKLPPSFTSTPHSVAIVDATYTYSISTRGQPGEKLTITTLQPLPAWLTLTDNDDGTATLTGTPTKDDINSLSSITLSVQNPYGVSQDQRFLIKTIHPNLGYTLTLQLNHYILLKNDSVEATGTFFADQTAMVNREVTLLITSANRPVQEVLSRTDNLGQFTAAAKITHADNYVVQAFANDTFSPIQNLSVVESDISLQEISLPQNHAEIYPQLPLIMGKATDNEQGTLIKQVELTLQDQDTKQYLNIDSDDTVTFSTTPQWIVAEGKADWFVNTNQVTWMPGHSYLVTARAIDLTGVVSAERTAWFTIEDQPLHDGYSCCYLERKCNWIAVDNMGTSSEESKGSKLFTECTIVSYILPTYPGTSSITPIDSILPSSGQIRFSVDLQPVHEKDSNITLWVERKNGSQGRVTVDYNYTLPDGIIGKGGQLVWEDGVINFQPIYIDIGSVNVASGNQQLTVTLSNPTGGAILEDSQRTITILKRFANNPEIMLSSFSDNGQDIAIDLPTLGCIATDNTGSPLNLDPEIARCKGGISVEGQEFTDNTIIKLDQKVKVVGRMTVDPQHVGKEAELVLFAGYRPLAETGAPETFFMLDTTGAISIWSHDVSELKAWQAAKPLEPTFAVTLYEGQFILPGRLTVFFGYRLEDGTVVQNDRSIEVQIDE